MCSIYPIQQSSAHTKMAPKRRKESQESLIEQAKKILEKPKKRKFAAAHHSYDPQTGRRIFKGPYRPSETTSSRPRRNDRAEGGSCDLDEGNSDIDLSFDDCSQGEPLIAMIQQATNLLQGKSSQQVHPKSWKQRVVDLQESWDNSRGKIFETVLSGCTMPTGSVCRMCACESPLIKCRQCGIDCLLCGKCDLNVHVHHPLHDREFWQNGFFQPLLPTQGLDSKGNITNIKRCLPYAMWNPSCPSCCSKDLETLVGMEMIIVVTQQGRFDLNSAQLQCKQCGHVDDPMNIEDIIKAGFWPGTPSKIHYIFNQDLFLEWDLQQKRMPGTSEGSFVKALEDFSVFKGRVGIINSSTFRQACREWKFCQYELNCVAMNNWMACPSCSVHQHSCHADGNMKLYRYKSSGRRKKETYYGDIFIASNNDVDNHMRAVYKSTVSKNYKDDDKCGGSHWRAAGNKPKRKGNLDETGLEIAGCRHGLAQWAVNMFQGELYGYAHFLQVKRMIPNKVEFFWEDIVCKYWKWANRISPEVRDSGMKPALSVMHAKGHSWSCQVLFGGRWQEGAALSTGEEVEQINSYLSRVGNTTKYMLPEGRDELITEHALSWNRRKILGFVDHLCSKYARVETMLKSLQKERDEILKDLEEIGLIPMKEPLSAEEEFYSLHHILHQVQVLSELVETSDEPTALLVETHDLYRKAQDHVKGSVAKKKRYQELEVLLTPNEEKVLVLERGKEQVRQRTLASLKKKIEHVFFSINQRTMDVQKLAESSKQRMKLRRKICQEKQDLEVLVSKHNTISNETSLDSAEVLKGTFPWQTSGVPVRGKRLILEKIGMIKRCEEEQKLLKYEMSNLLVFYVERLVSVLDEKIHRMNEEQTAISTLTDPVLPTEDVHESHRVIPQRYAIASKTTDVLRGVASLLKKHRAFCVQEIERAVVKFGMILEGDLQEFLPTHEYDAQSDETAKISDGETISEDPVVIDISVPSTENGTAPTVIVPFCRHGNGRVGYWLFPTSISQSTLDGRNGSSACSIIAILFAAAIFHARPHVPREEALTAPWEYLMRNCIRMGNNVYDSARSSSRQIRFLSTLEAANLLEGSVDVKVDAPLPVRLEDPHIPTTLLATLCRFCESPQIAFAVFIFEGKSVLFVSLGSGNVALLDSHLHHELGGGALLVLGHRDFLAEFVNVCQSFLQMSTSIYGNFTPISFTQT